MVKFARLVMRGEILFLNGNIKLTSMVMRSKPYQLLHCLLFSGLFLQACAITKTETRVLPGKELSRVSQGFREIESNIVLKEITSYSIGITRRACEAEFITVEHQGLIEATHERRELSCAHAIPEYALFQVMALGIPLLYDMVSGFGIFREMCEKGPPVYSKNTLDSNTTVTQIIIDRKTSVCRDHPVTNAEVGVTSGTTSLTLVSSEAGTVALSPEQITAITKSTSQKGTIQFRYKTEIMTAAFSPLVASEPQIMAKLDDQNAVVKNGTTGSAATAVNSANMMNKISGSANKISGTAKNNVQAESQMMAKLNDQNAAIKNSTKGSGDASSNAENKINKIAGNVNRISGNTTNNSPAESQMMARLDDQNAAIKNSTKGSDAAVEYTKNRISKISGGMNKVSGDVNQKAAQMMARQAEKNGGGSSEITTAKSWDKPDIFSHGLSSSNKDVPSNTTLNGVRVTREAIHLFAFANNKSNLRKEYRADLKRIAIKMKANPEMHSIIEGYTDNIGRDISNRKISLRRATTIKDILVNTHGIAAKRVHAYGYGLTKPVADNSSAKGRAKNRRVEIYTTDNAVLQ